MVVKMYLKDSFDSATSISCAFCEQTGKPIFRKTVSRRLDKEKLVTGIPCRKLLNSKKNQKVHVDFAIGHILRTEEQFRDETKFNLFGSDGRGLKDVKMGNAYLLNALRKLLNLEGERNSVRDDFFSWSRINCSFSR